MIFTAIKLFFTIGRGAKIIPFIMKYWKPLLLAAVLIGGYFYHSHLINTIEKLETENAHLTTELGKCKGKIDEQNEEILVWADRAKEQRLEMERLQGLLDKADEDVRKRVENILKEKKPESCEAAIDYLVDSIGDLAW